MENITIYIAGDSTVCIQHKPAFGSWGHVLHQFFGEGVLVANHAKSGRSTKSFIDEGRLAPIAQEISAGDYFLIQFGHNDQKGDHRHTEPFEGYTENLKIYVNTARNAGALPVLVTPVYRRRFDEQGNLFDTHGDYPAAVRNLAAAENVPLIDLHKKSGELFARLGPEKTKEIFLHLPENNPHYPNAIQDDTHFSEYGGMEICKLVIAEIREKTPDLARFLKREGEND